MTKNFKHYLEPEQPLTHEFFNTLYWYAYSRDSRHPQTGVRSFLGLIKDLVNKVDVGIPMGSSSSGIRCSFFDDDDNKLEKQVLFAYDPTDWEEREASQIFVDNNEFSRFVCDTLEKFKRLQQKTWSLYPEIKEIEEKEIELIKNLLNNNLSSNTTA